MTHDDFCPICPNVARTIRLARESYERAENLNLFMQDCRVVILKLFDNYEWEQINQKINDQVMREFEAF
jgi:hypothetical protein